MTAVDISEILIFDNQVMICVKVHWNSFFMTYHHCLPLDLKALKLRQLVPLDSLIDERSQYLKVILFLETLLECFICWIN